MRQIAMEAMVAGIDVTTITKFGTSFAVLSGLGAGVFKSVTVVKEGEIGICSGWGRVKFSDAPGPTNPAVTKKIPKAVGAGTYFRFPGTHPIHKKSTQDRANNLEQFNLDRGAQYTVRSSVIWRVMPDAENVYRALYKVDNDDNLKAAVTDLCLGGLRTIMRDTSRVKDSDLENCGLLQEALQEQCSEDLSEYGVELRRLSSVSCARSLGQMLSGEHAAVVLLPEVTQAADGPHLTVIQGELDT